MRLRRGGRRTRVRVYGTTLRLFLLKVQGMEGLAQEGLTACVLLLVLAFVAGRPRAVTIPARGHRRGQVVSSETPSSGRERASSCRPRSVRNQSGDRRGH